jgi:hypothetical protein
MCKKLAIGIAAKKSDKSAIDTNGMWFVSMKSNLGLFKQDSEKLC